MGSLLVLLFRRIGMFFGVRRARPVDAGTLWDEGATSWDAGATRWDVRHLTPWDSGTTLWDSGNTTWEG